MDDAMPQIHCSFDNGDQLYPAYMPFITGGGVFVRTKQSYKLGTEVLLKIQIMDEKEPYEVEGRIIWITPKGAQGNKPAGVGVQFVGENRRMLVNKIETSLAGMLKSTQTTDSI